jgi:hypothetical protein
MIAAVTDVDLDLEIFPPNFVAGLRKQTCRRSVSSPDITAQSLVKRKPSRYGLQRAVATGPSYGFPDAAGDAAGGALPAGKTPAPEFGAGETPGEV